jgi:hypothetical protein
MTTPEQVSIVVPETSVQVPMKVCRSVPATSTPPSEFALEVTLPQPARTPHAAIATHAANRLPVAERRRPSFESIIRTR